MADLSNVKLSMKWLLAPALAVMVGGCVQNDDSQGTPPIPSPQPVDVNSLLPAVDAGLEEKDILATNATRDLSNGMPFLVRGNPFSLLRQENAYEASQRAERFLQEGGFVTMWTPPPPPPDIAPSENVEPQPYRRLAGILIGDSVMAIVEMEDGRTYIIRPGTAIPGTEWRVISVDSEKAVLKRPGPRRPTQITVKLEARPSGMPSGGGGGGGGPRGSGAGGMEPPPGGGQGGMEPPPGGGRGMLPGVGG